MHGAVLPQGHGAVGVARVLPAEPEGGVLHLEAQVVLAGHAAQGEAGQQLLQRDARAAAATAIDLDVWMGIGAGVVQSSRVSRGGVLQLIHPQARVVAYLEGVGLLGGLPLLALHIVEAPGPRRHL